ncbi:hypothetical protein CCP3SC15_1310001 [Gammaproteobacteria bacterium]
MGELPPEMMDRTIAPEGETYREFVERTMADMEKRVETASRDEGIASHMTEAEQAITRQETHAEAVTTRQLMKEKFMDAFGLDETQADAYMQLSNSLADWYAKTTGADADSFYKDYYADVVKGNEDDFIGGLKQAYGRIEVADRKMTATDAENYARMLVRGGEGELTRAIRNEPNKADRIAILDAAHNLNADMAQSVAKSQLDILFQETGQTAGAKGMVDFVGMKATIYAFEAKDFTTLVHENGHVFRRTLKDVAERTGNAQILRDLATVEEWAGVKDGVWKVEHEEKFARGFEEYVATGKAPLPKLKAAFEMMKSWMMDVYKSITGSDIDVKVSDDVRAVFDRMLGAEDARMKDEGGRMNDPVRAWDGLRQSNMTKDAITFKANEVLPDGFTQALRDAGFEQVDVIGQEWKAGRTPEAESLINRIGKPAPETKRTNPYSPTVRTDLPNQPIQKDSALYQRNLEKVKGGQVDMFGEQTVDGGQLTVDSGTTGGLLPGMQESTGMMFDVQPGSGQLRRMEAPAARSLYDVDPTRTVSDKAGTALSAGDIVMDENGKRYNVKGANLRGKVVTADGKILESASVERVARQDVLFQRAEPVNTPAFKDWFGESKVTDENGKPLVVYHSTGESFTNFKEGQHFGTQEQSNQIVKSMAETTARREGMGIVPEKPTAYQTVPVYLSIKNPMRVEDFGGKPAAWEAAIKSAKEQGYDGLVYENWGEFDTKKNGDVADSYVAFEPEQIKSTANRGTFDPNNPNILFQREPVNVAGEQPFGSLDAAAGDNGLFHGEVMDEGWRTQVQPLMDAMKQGALESLNNKPLDGAVRDMSPEGQKMLRQYMKQVQNEMASTKLATMRWGETKRDEALLNYGKRYGIDRYMEAVYPYQFFYTRSMGAWAARAIDKPAWFANYARIKRQQDRYERDIPERLRGKIKISMPWMPDWMGDAMYIDPMANLFTPANYLKPFERMQKDSTGQQQEAERVIQEWSANDTISQTDLTEALQTRSGTTWERALAEAQIRRKSEIANPMDFFNTMFGPAWYLTTPMKLLNGEATGVTSTPLLNTTRAIDTVTQGTWAEGAGNAIGMIGRPEQWIQKKLGVPEFGEYGDYYIDRQLANMTAEGVITAEDAQVAMMERNGATFEQARERVKMELAMKVPTMAALMAGLTADNFAQGVGRAAATLPASLFGSGLLPEGEIKYRGLKQEWNEAWKKSDNGDKTAIPEFFDEHPEYQAYLSKGKQPEERLRSFLVGQIWDGYMALGETNQKQARKEMGDLFSQSFLDKETRSYDTLTVDQLTNWAQMLQKKVPTTPQTAPALEQPAPQLNLYDKNVTDITDTYYKQRREKFPDYYQVESGYYNIPKSERTAYLLAHPDLKQYWTWKDKWNSAYPELSPVFKGQVFKTVDTSGWSPYLVDYVAQYAMTGEKLGKGAQKALEQQWIMAGRPMDNMQSWLDSQVAPAMLYGGQ